MTLIKLKRKEKRVSTSAWFLGHSSISKIDGVYSLEKIHLRDGDSLTPGSKVVNFIEFKTISETNPSKSLQQEAKRLLRYTENSLYQESEDLRI